MKRMKKMKKKKLVVMTLKRKMRAKRMKKKIKLVMMTLKRKKKNQIKLIQKKSFKKSGGFMKKVNAFIKDP